MTYLSELAETKELPKKLEKAIKKGADMCVCDDGLTWSDVSLGLNSCVKVDCSTQFEGMLGTPKLGGCVECGYGCEKCTSD